MVILCGSTLGHLIVGDIRNLTEQTRHLLLCLVHGVLQLLVGLLHLGHLGLDSISLSLLAFLHQTTNLGSHLLGLAQVLVEFLLSLTTTLVNSQHLVDSLFSTLEMFLLQAANHALGFLSNEFKCKHNLYLFFIRAIYLPRISNSRLTTVPTRISWKFVCSMV